MKNVINTPFGNFYVKLNGSAIDFQCVSKIYSQTKSKNNIRLYVINVDTTNITAKAQITCGFENTILEHYNKNTLIAEDQNLILGLSGSQGHPFCVETYNENGFQYVIEKNEEFSPTENNITLVLCCVEKDKFKDPKQEISDALISEMKDNYKKENKKEKIKKEPKKESKHTLLTIFLFILFLILYLLISVVLVEQKIITNVTTQKMMIGIIGVLLISFACGNLGVKVVSKPKKRSPKRQYIITMILLILLFASLEMIIYMILCATGMIQNELLLFIGLTIVSISFVAIIASSWKPKKEKTIELEKKIDFKVEQKESEKQPNLELLELEIAFPKNLKKDLLYLAQTIEEKTEKSSVNNLDSTYLLNHESITVPYRIYYDEIKEIDNLTENQKRMLYCIYTRNPDGHVREKYIEKLLQTELQEWEFPYIIKASEDYVVEIIQTMYDGLKEKENQQLKQFVEHNKNVVVKSYHKMISYWNLYYRETPFHRYVGRKLFRECFGYSKRMEMKRFKCACCGNYTIHGYLINYYHAPCPVCHWQNNIEQNNNAFLVNDINPISLNEARKNYETMKAIDGASVSKVREPLEVEKESINVARILKFLKLNLIKMGCTRKKDQIHPFYEFQNQYFRIVFFKETNEFILETTKTLEKAKNNEWIECKRYDINYDKKDLFKDIFNIIKKQTKPAKPKKLTKAEKTEIIKEEINKWDPVGLIKKGASADEYNVEITKIASKINQLKTKEELGKHIEQVFQKMFGENIFKNDKKEVEKIAKQILQRIKSA